MARFKKKPMEVEAIRFLAGHPVPPFVLWSEEKQQHYVSGEGTSQPLHMPVNYGDWLITGASGQHYGCPHDDFLKIYEPVDERPEGFKL